MSKIKNNYLTHSLYCECGSCYNGGRKYMKNILKSTKQFLCPIIGTWYLFGGWEYGHRWSRLDGENRIFCTDCLKQVYCYTYKPDGIDSKRYKEYKEILDVEVKK